MKERKVTQRDKAALARGIASTEAHARDLYDRGLVRSFEANRWQSRKSGRLHEQWKLRLTPAGEAFAEACRKEQAR